MMSLSESKDVEITLQKPGIHQQWYNDYRTVENERFYEQAFDYIRGVLNAPKSSTILDVGCGSGAHSVRLANRGFSVLAVDFSESALKAARGNLEKGNFLEKIKLQHENILEFSFDDSTFDYVLCWGVLMHMPDIEKAISELDRVLKKDGILVISEGNMFSLESMVLRSLKLLLHKEKATVKKTSAGLEYWDVTLSGKLLTRQANVGWLKEKFKNRGFAVKEHVAGQFTELYTRFSSAHIRKLIHYFNYLWFRYVKKPSLAFGNIIILKK